MPFYKIDSDEVLKEISKQSLKRWWVAEQAGIHKTTLRRWLSGRIDKVRSEHVEGLARVLEIAPEAIAKPFDA